MTVVPVFSLVRGICLRVYQDYAELTRLLLAQRVLSTRSRKPVSARRSKQAEAQVDGAAAQRANDPTTKVVCFSSKWRAVIASEA